MSELQRERHAAIDQTNMAMLVAHEFRTPVHAIQAYLSVLLEERAGSINEIQRDFLSSMYLIASRLERLTNDLQVVMATNGKFPIHKQEVDIASLVEACCRFLQPLAEGFDVRVAGLVARGEMRPAWVDPIRIEQIVINLVENAIRYSIANSTVVVRLLNSPYRIALSIENEASAIIRQDIREWFTAFTRGPSSGTTHPQGTGLGLSVVDLIVRAHRGTILTRARGQVVTIMVVIPRHAADTAG